jgi:septum formation protein
MQPDLILASQSPWRIKMLADAGIFARGIPAPIDEYQIQSPDPLQLAQSRAMAKARSVQELFPDSWVIGADQVAWLEIAGQITILEKPVSPKDHLAQLQLLRGRRHCLSTALVLAMPHQTQQTLEHSRIQLYAELSDPELEQYVASGEGSGCCGGYQAEARGALLIERIEGDWFNVLGLPLYTLIRLLRQEGWKSPLQITGAVAENARTP